MRLGAAPDRLQGLRQALVRVGIGRIGRHGHLEALDRLPPAGLAQVPDPRLVMSRTVVKVPVHRRRVELRRAAPLLAPGAGGEDPSEIDVVAWVRRREDASGAERLLCREDLTP